MLTVLGTLAGERGVRFGRPRKLTPDQREEALRRLAAGETQADVELPACNDRYQCRIRAVARKWDSRCPKEDRGGVKFRRKCGKFRI
jgi:hypothetical protein